MRVLTRRELPNHRRVALEREAAHARNSVRTESGGGRRRTLYCVKGRVSDGGGGGAILWDVYALEGEDDPAPKVAAVDFVWRDEAIACARDLSLGKMSISFGGMRGIFARGAGKILVPDRSVRSGEASGVRLRPSPHGLIVMPA